MEMSPDAEPYVGFKSSPGFFLLERTGSITILGRGQFPRGGGEGGLFTCCPS